MQSRGVITLDAFARCWVQEDRLLAAVTDLLPAEKHAEMGRLREAWRARNLEVFAQAMRVIAGHIADTAADAETVPEKLDAATLAARARALFARDRGDRRDPAVEGAMSALTRRLDERLRADTDRLIALHGLSGRAKQPLLERASGQFDVARPADVAGTSLAGGMLAGAAGGLAADLSAGGFTLGAGMIIGAIVGALGAGSAAKAYNILQGQEDGRVRWSADFVSQRARAALLLYLAVAHYGRGRGDWVEGEAPAHWPPLVEEVMRDHLPELAAACQADEAGADAMAPRIDLVVAAAAREMLARLYPDSRSLF